MFVLTIPEIVKIVIDSMMDSHRRGCGKELMDDWLRKYLEPAACDALREHLALSQK